MASRRCLKAAEAIRQVVSTAILAELRDPRVENVTVTYVEVTADMRQAKVHVSVMGDDTKQNLCLHGLRNSAGFLQQRVSDRIDARYTPRLTFFLDQGVKKSIEINRLLKTVLPEKSGDVEDPGEESTGTLGECGNSGAGVDAPPEMHPPPDE